MTRRTRDELPSTPLSILLGGYFHQDWIIEGSNPRAVVEQFIDDSTRDEVTAAQKGAERLLASSADERWLKRTLQEMGLYYLPEADGLSYREWLQDVVDLLGSSRA